MKLSTLLPLFALSSALTAAAGPRYRHLERRQAPSLSPSPSSSSTSSSPSASPTSPADQPCSVDADCHSPSYFCNHYGHGIAACLAYRDCRGPDPAQQCAAGQVCANPTPADQGADWTCQSSGSSVSSSSSASSSNSASPTSASSTFSSSSTSSPTPSPSGSPDGQPCTVDTDCHSSSYFCNHYGHGIAACLAYRDCRGPLASQQCTAGQTCSNPTPDDPGADWTCQASSGGGSSSSSSSPSSSVSSTSSTASSSSSSSSSASSSIPAPTPSTVPGDSSYPPTDCRSRPGAGQCPVSFSCQADDPTDPASDYSCYRSGFPDDTGLACAGDYDCRAPGFFCLASDGTSSGPGSCAAYTDCRGPPSAGKYCQAGSVCQQTGLYTWGCVDNSLPQTGAGTPLNKTYDDCRSGGCPGGYCTANKGQGGQAEYVCAFDLPRPSPSASSSSIGTPTAKPTASPTPMPAPGPTPAPNPAPAPSNSPAPAPAPQQPSQNPAPASSNNNPSSSSSSSGTAPADNSDGGGTSTTGASPNDNAKEALVELAEVMQLLRDLKSELDEVRADVAAIKSKVGA